MEKSTKERVLRLGGWSVLVFVALLELTDSLAEPRAWALGAATGMALAAVVGLSLWVMRASRGLSRSQVAELVAPLGWLLMCDQVIAGLTALFPQLRLAEPLPIVIPWTGAVLSLRLLLHLAALVMFSAWETALILHVLAAHERSDREMPLTRSLAEARRSWPRFAGLALFGWLGIFALSVPGLALLDSAASAEWDSKLAIALPLAMIFAATFLWNVATAGLYFGISGARGSFVALFRERLAASWRVRSSTWLLILLQMLALGVINVTYVTTAVTAGARNAQTHVRVDALWTGGYALQNRWYEAWQRALGQAEAPFLRTILFALFALLAMAIKVRVAKALERDENIRRARTAFDEGIVSLQSPAG